MKINFQRLCRFFVPLVLATCLVIALAVPSFAAEIDLYDHITDIVKGEDGDTVFVTLDPSAFGGGIYLYDRTAGTNKFYSGNFVTASFVAGHAYSFLYRPFQGSSNYLSSDDIPAGTQVQIRYKFIDNANVGGSTNLSAYVTYLSSSGNQTISTTSIGGTNLSNILSWEFNPPSGTYGFSFISDLVCGTAPISGSFTFGVESVQIVMRISEAYVQQVQTGKTNKLLGAIEDKLADQNDKLDDTNDKLDEIINGTVPPPTTPSGGDIIDDYEDLEDDVLGEIQSGLDIFEDLYDNVDLGIQPYISSLMAVSTLIDHIIGIPFLSALVFVSLALGLCSFILSLGSLLSKKGGRK